MPKEERPKLNCRVIIEMLGAPKEHIAETIRTYVAKIKDDYKTIKILREFYEEPMLKDKMYSTFAELDLEVSGVENLVSFCFDYMPSSVEIFEPEEIVYRTRDLTDFINDLQAKLHKVDMALKNLSAENQILRKMNSSVLKNIIKLLLKSGPKDVETLVKDAGMTKDAAEKVMVMLIAERAVLEKDGLYSLA